MSIRAMILVQYGEAWASPYHMYYRHYDGYPTGLGDEMVRAMIQGKSIDDVLKEVGAEDEHETVSKLEDAFLKYQGDLEWIYVIRNPDNDNRSLEILKTSYPTLIENDFVFSVLCCYQKYFDNAPSMQIVQYVGSVMKLGMVELLKSLEASLKKAASSSEEVS